MHAGGVVAVAIRCGHHEKVALDRLRLHARAHPRGKGKLFDAAVGAGGEERYWARQREGARESERESRQGRHTDTKAERETATERQTRPTESGETEGERRRKRETERDTVYVVYRARMSCAE